MATTNMTPNMTSLDNLTATVPAYYDIAYRIVAVPLLSIIFVVGIVGNILVVVVVVKTRSMHTTTNCYLLSLALADCLVLLSATLPAIPECFFRLDEWRYGTVLCHTLIFIQYMGTASSALSITAFTVERYIAVCHTMRAQTICTVHRAKRIIIILWIFTVSYSSPWFFLTTTKPRHYLDGTSDERCDFKYDRKVYRTYYMLDMVVFYVVPILLTVALYGLICRVLLGASDNSDNAVKLTKTHNSSSTVHANSSRNQVIRMLCVVVILFILLWMPYRLLVVYNSFAMNDFLDLWFLLFCRTLVYINSAINPILYNAMSVKFRRAFRMLLFCGKGENHDRRSIFMNAENSDVAHSKSLRRGDRSSASRMPNGSERQTLSLMESNP